MNYRGCLEGWNISKGLERKLLKLQAACNPFHFLLWVLSYIYFKSSRYHMVIAMQHPCCHMQRRAHYFWMKKTQCCVRRLKNWRSRCQISPLQMSSFWIRMLSFEWGVNVRQMLQLSLCQLLLSPIQEHLRCRSSQSQHRYSLLRHLHHNKWWEIFPDVRTQSGCHSHYDLQYTGSKAAEDDCWTLHSVLISNQFTLKPK